MSAFEQLHPAIRYHIVNTLGWDDLRPTQMEAIAPIHAGEDVLLLAPTAGGKTEAAFLPLLSRAATQSWTGLSVLYLCPLKALLNNLEPGSAATLASLAAKWGYGMATSVRLHASGCGQTRRTFFSPRQSRLRRFWYRLGSTINLCWAACVPLWSTSCMPLRGTTEDGTYSPFWLVSSDLPEGEFNVLAFRPRSEILAICWRGSSGTEVAA